jgi:hypothetical protein
MRVNTWRTTAFRILLDHGFYYTLARIEYRTPLYFVANRSNRSNSGKIVSTFEMRVNTWRTTAFRILLDHGFYYTLARIEYRTPSILRGAEWLCL